MNQLGARGFHYVGLGREHSPFLERDATLAQRYEYRVIQISQGTVEQQVNQAAREGFSVVTLAVDDWGAHYVVMERSDASAEHP